VAPVAGARGFGYPRAQPESMMRLVPLLFGCALLLGCAGVFGFEPEEGDYDVKIDNVELSDACIDIWGFDDALEDDTVVEVEVSEDEIELVDIVTCDRDGVAFDCEDEVEQVVDDADAIVFAELDIVGEFLTATTFEADLTQVLSCVGSDCGDLGTDCEITGTWEGALDE